MAIIKLLVSRRCVENVVMTDRNGAIYKGRPGLNPAKQEIAEIDKPDTWSKGSLPTLSSGADVFIGVSAPGSADAGHGAALWTRDAIIFACANPTPEIMPGRSQGAPAQPSSAPGRSDYPNQVNNVLGIPGNIPRRARRESVGHQQRNEDCGGGGARLARLG